MDWKHKIDAGQRVIVMGMGISGRAAVAFLLSKAATVFVTDSRDFKDLPEDDQRYLRENNISFEGGGHSREFMSQGDFIVVSPGVPTDLAILIELQSAGIPFLGELALAAPYLTESVIAVTGTNGKTTVTSLIGELLRASGKEVFVGGNIGTPVLDYLRQGKRADYLVLELSSFQLESAGNFCPHIAVLLNITPDHMDRHKTMARYAAAKMKLFTHQKSSDKAILCGDDPMCQQIEPMLVEQEVYCFSGLTPHKGVSVPSPNSFQKNTKRIYKVLKRKCAARGSDREFSVTIADRVEHYSLQGTALDSHTGLLNSQAAVLAVSLLGCKHDTIVKGLNDFTPAEHRLQHVRTLDGVEYYNDSKATNTGAVLSALESFSGNIILLVGGKDKGEDYSVLKELVDKKVKTLVLIGETGDAIADAVDWTNNSFKASSMNEAVRRAADIASPGDVVLLAPACSSFDMFTSYGHRGKVFMEAVLKLPGELKEEAV